jgi:divalent metal cation (Fe/Co/Zn/Cd) transporter
MMDSVNPMMDSVNPMMDSVNPTMDSEIHHVILKSNKG